MYIIYMYIILAVVSGVARDLFIVTVERDSHGPGPVAGAKGPVTKSVFMLHAYTDGSIIITLSRL